MFARSASSVPCANTLSADFFTGRDSPVSADSSTFNWTAVNSLASAGTYAPADTSIISPGTSFPAAISKRTPSRYTTAVGADIFFSASRDFSAFSSCTTPRMAFNITMARIITGSVKSVFPSNTEAAKEISAAAIRTRIIKSSNCSKNRRRKLFFFFCVNSFFPYWFRRFAASFADSPPSLLLFCSRTTSAALRVYAAIAIPIPPYLYQSLISAVIAWSLWFTLWYKRIKYSE